ncbi:SPOR domain-containing protein [Sphingomonas sp. ASV193]|uniref:SPOR domain-containing protein n=1 Tax=Sphingomonas sp. ASV193 TaxID=3144405 RepID=UPI0032E8D3AF
MNDGRAYDEQGLPWLEAVDDEDGPRPIPAGKMLAAIVVVLLAIGAVAGTFYWIGHREPVVSGAPELIKAPPGPYKVKPDDPGGLDVAGDSSTAFATSAGQDTDAALDQSKMGSEDLPAPPPPAAATTPAKPVAPPSPKPAPTATAPDAAPSGIRIQLGAYGSTTKADTAWSMLSSRFPAVGGLSKRVEKYSGGYRLRAVAPDMAAAKAACAALTAGGENCFVVP